MKRIKKYQRKHHGKYFYSIYPNSFPTNLYFFQKPEYKLTLKIILLLPSSDFVLSLFSNAWDLYEITITIVFTLNVPFVVIFKHLVEFIVVHETSLYLLFIRLVSMFTLLFIWRNLNLTTYTFNWARLVSVYRTNVKSRFILVNKNTGG